MPKVSVNNDPLLERLIFAYDGTSYRVVKCDTDGNVVAALKAGQTVEVTQDTAADLKATVNVAAAQTIAVTQATAASLKALVDLNTDQNVQAREYGWIGAAWQKQPQALGYSGQAFEEKSNLSADAGLNSLTGTAVPAGEIWKVTFIEASNQTSTSTTLNVYVALTGVNIVVLQATSTVALTWYIWNGEVVLEPGDTVNAVFYGCTAGDDIYLRYYGVRVDTDQ